MRIDRIIADTPAPAEALFPKWRGREPLEPHRAEVEQRLAARFPQLSDHATDAAFDRFEAAHPAAPVHRYNQVPAKAAAQVAMLPTQVRAAWVCALMLRHMARFDAAFAATGLPDEFALHYVDQFHRILDSIDSEPEFAALESDTFLKDLWLTRLVMIPAFAQMWWPRSGLSARTILKAGPRAIAYVFLECGGRDRFLEGHTHDPVARAYWNAPGWAEALRLAALALPALPQVRGAFGSAWFYDPAVLEITPRISFTQDLQAGQGALRIRVGSDADAIANATRTSATRRERYRDGSYLPTDYAFIWSRKRLIARYGA